MVNVVYGGTEEKILKILALIKDKISYPLEVHMLSKKKSPPKQDPISKPPICKISNIDSDKLSKKGCITFQQLLMDPNYNPYSILTNLDEMPIFFTTRPKRKKEELIEPKSKSGGQELLQNESSKIKY